jgi:hypothetical protein
MRVARRPECTERAPGEGVDVITPGCTMTRRYVTVLTLQVVAIMRHAVGPSEPVHVAVSAVARGVSNGGQLVGALAPLDPRRDRRVARPTSLTGATFDAPRRSLQIAVGRS